MSLVIQEKRTNSEILLHNFTLCVSTGVFESRTLSSICILLTLAIGYSVIIALTGLPIGYSVIVALTGLPKGYSVIVALTGLPVGYSVMAILLLHRLMELTIIFPPANQMEVVFNWKDEQFHILTAVKQ